MKSFLLLGIACVVGFFVFRDWINAPDPKAKTADPGNASEAPVDRVSALDGVSKPAGAQGSFQNGHESQLDPIEKSWSDARKVEALATAFDVRVAVDRLAEQWERRRRDATHNEQTMQQTGAKEFALLVRRIQDAGLYAERALEDVVRAALEHERPAASPAQREILLDGIFQTMRINEPEA